jgi:uncharacterized protein (TIGR00730 family)
MEAANRGAHEAGAPTIGFNITLPHEQRPNPYTTPELTFRFHYFAMRKMHLSDLADAFIAMPGGFGTFDELFEILTWAQLGIHAKPIGILNVAGYFDALIRMVEVAITQGFVSKTHGRLFVVETDPQALIAALRTHPMPAVRRWVTSGQR